MSPSVLLLLTIFLFIGTGLSKPHFPARTRYKTEVQLPSVISARIPGTSGGIQTANIVSEILTRLGDPITQAVDAHFAAQNQGSRTDFSSLRDSSFSSQSATGGSSSSSVDGLVREIISKLTPIIRRSVDQFRLQQNSQTSSTISSQSSISQSSSSVSQERLVSSIMTTLQPQIMQLVSAAISRQQREEEVKRREDERKQEERRRQEVVRRQADIRRQDDMRRQQQASQVADQQRRAEEERRRLEQQRVGFGQGNAKGGIIEDLFGSGLEILHSNQDQEILNIKLPGREIVRVG